jgi:predicted translin family RNA/ssDNA-binding protein
MHRRSLGILAIGLGIILSQPLAVVAQTSTKDVTQKAGETTDAIKAYTVDKKNEAVAYAKKLVRDLDAKIKELEAQASRVTGDAKTKLQQELKELKVLRDKAAKKADELSKASAESWDSVKGGFADAYTDLRRAYDKAAANLRK